MKRNKIENPTHLRIELCMDLDLDNLDDRALLQVSQQSWECIYRKQRKQLISFYSLFCICMLLVLNAAHRKILFVTPVELSSVIPQPTVVKAVPAAGEEVASVTIGAVVALLSFMIARS